jgi:small subunit ribosomal protein S26e
VWESGEVVSGLVAVANWIVGLCVFRNMVDASALRDIRDASVYENYTLPKLYVKMHYCIEAAVHQRIVRVRSSEGRKVREAPQRVRPKQN